MQSIKGGFLRWIKATRCDGKFIRVAKCLLLKVQILAYYNSDFVLFVIEPFINMFKEVNMIAFDVKKLDIKQIFECGQAFRWELTEEGKWLGVVGQTVALCWQEGERLFIEALNQVGEDPEFWKRYFDLERDYEALKIELYKRSPDLSDALAFGSGIRLLNQDFFEMTMTFILSSNNHIPRIKQLVERLSERYGQSLHRLGERTYYSFPKPEVLAEADLAELRELGLGYRDTYVLETAKTIVGSSAAFEALKDCTFREAKASLLQLSGVGPKVADCILLFGLGRYEAFPIDTWVKKTLSRRYQLGDATQKVIEAFVDDRFGDLKGFAQQFLFYFERENERSKVK